MSNEYSLSATTDAYKLPTITDVTTSSTSSSITINVSGKAGDGAITEYYYSKDNGSNYVKSTSSSYTFTELTSSTTFYIKVYVKDSNGKSSSVFTTNNTTILTIADYVISQYTRTQGDNGIYYHESSLANGAGDNSYRYAGASDSVNNYICLGSDATTCPDANLFRIIGVFGDKTKVIRVKSVGNQKWNTSADNTWSSSSLNAYLNGEYLTSVGTVADKIATTTWKVGGGTIRNITTSVPKTAYQYEVGSSASSTTYDAKIGLMYVSDYGFAADPSAWTTKLSSYNSNTSKNWLFLDSTEWTISRNSDSSDDAFYVHSGYLAGSSVLYSLGVRPVFNLLSSVTYASGSGTSSDPIRINL